MAAGNPTANLAQALATIANAFALNQSGPNVAPTQSTSVATSVSRLAPVARRMRVPMVQVQDRHQAGT